LKHLSNLQPTFCRDYIEYGIDTLVKVWNFMIPVMWKRNPGYGTAFI
jgi:hypothetical protein